jgi:hypothetical protein
MSGENLCKKDTQEEKREPEGKKSKIMYSIFP